MEQSATRTGMARREGLRIYNLFPTLAGTIRQWTEQLPRIAAMRFNAVYLNPFHFPGFSGSLYAVKDYYRLNPRFRDGERDDDDTLLRGFTDAAREHGLRVIMDLVVNHAAKDCDLVTTHPRWFARDADGGLVSPWATDPADPSRRTVWGDLAEFDYGSAQRSEILAYFQQLVLHYIGLGFAGFRCDAAYKIPADIWRGLTEAARSASIGALFCAETLGASEEAVLALADAGFDYLFNSVKWWDFDSPWLLDQYEKFRRIAPSIGFPESHDTPRLATELLARGVPEAEIAPRYRQAYAFAAAYSAGVMMPIGFEYGWARRLDVVAGGSADEPKRFDLGEFIAEVNAAKEGAAALNEEGPQRRLSERGDPLVALLRQGADGGGGTVILVNTDARAARTMPLDRLPPPTADPAISAYAQIFPRRQDLRGSAIEVEPLAVTLLEARKAAAEADRAVPMPAQWRREARIQIEEVYPELDGGRYPVKRIVGEVFEVWADLFCDGHDKLRAVLRYRPPGEAWREAPFAFFDNDRWVGRFGLDRVGLWQYTIEAWIDRFESWQDEFAKKREAGQQVTLELDEGRAVVAAAQAEAGAGDRDELDAILREFDRADGAVRIATMTSPRLREVMARASPRADRTRYARDLEIVVDRQLARFGAWYEMFARSQGRVPGRSATFDDCVARLPEIADLGFDVVYLPPIHPIGRVNRKGRNNSTAPGPGDPGSPYAIGSAEGGHRAVHSELGGIDGFRRFVRAAAEHRLEVALDFAVQCAPDHPWVREHPEWFHFRPDGTIKYAENPPKKYEDIVNVDFANPDWQGLWRELRDTVLFWVDQGVRIFRVDNPHTKPLPFWEWLIREVKGRCPEVFFLSEAFTRPKMMRALAKTGFGQSYTYFTWRNTKAELTEYLDELIGWPVNEYFRPNFFTNTPDILPFFLQQGGRPAFRIRLALAATLSPAYGIYNGFELCENTPIPDHEEYLDSEKYEYKVWDWHPPGNIKADIRVLNAFRRANPALQQLVGLRFLACADPNILAYAKMTADRSNVAVVAVNLDPFAAHRSEVEMPFDEFGVGDRGEASFAEAFTGQTLRCRDRRLDLSLDPQTNPVLLLRLIPPETR